MVCSPGVEPGLPFRTPGFEPGASANSAKSTCGVLGRVRTSDLAIISRVRCQLRYENMGCPADFDSATSGATTRRSYHLSYGHMATPAGLEPATFGVTGRRANQLRYGAIWRSEEDSNLQPGLPSTRFPSGVTTIITSLHLETRRDHFHTFSLTATAQKASTRPGTRYGRSMAVEAGLEPASPRGPPIFGTGRLPLSHSTRWRTEGDSNSHMSCLITRALAERRLAN